MEVTGIFILFFVVAIIGIIVSLVSQNTRSNGNRTINHSNFNQDIHRHTHSDHHMEINQLDISTNTSYVESYDTSTSASSTDSGSSESNSSSSGFDSGGGFDSGSSGSSDSGTNNN